MPVKKAPVSENYQPAASPAVSGAADRERLRPGPLAWRPETAEQISDQAAQLFGGNGEFRFFFHQNSILPWSAFQTPATVSPSRLSNVTVNGFLLTSVLYISSSSDSLESMPEMTLWM